MLLITVTLVTLFQVGIAQWLNNVNVPPCAQSCASLLPAECAGNPKCICGHDSWMIAAQCCVQNSCQSSDHAITEQFAAQLCNYVDKPINRPTNCPGVSRPTSSFATLSSSTKKSTTSKATATSTKPATATTKASSSSAKSSSSTKASSVASSKTSSAATPSGSAINGYKYQGCYTEATNGGRILDKTYWIDVIGMTVEKCISYCKSQNTKYAGLEYTQECWCGDEIVNGGQKTDQVKCNLPCKGDANEVCGGYSVLSVFKSG